MTSTDATNIPSSRGQVMSCESCQMVAVTSASAPMARAPIIARERRTMTSDGRFARTMPTRATLPMRLADDAAARLRTWTPTSPS